MEREHFKPREKWGERKKVEEQPRSQRPIFPLQGARRWETLETTLAEYVGFALTPFFAQPQCEKLRFRSAHTGTLYSTYFLQVKEMWRQNIQAAEEERKRHTAIIEEYKKVAVKWPLIS